MGAVSHTDSSTVSLAVSHTDSSTVSPLIVTLSRTDSPAVSQTAGFPQLVTMSPARLVTRCVASQCNLASNKPTIFVLNQTNPGSLIYILLGMTLWKNAQEDFNEDE